MTDPASPAAVTEERIAEIRAGIGIAPNYTQQAFRELFAAYDARGLELARRDEEVARLKVELDGVLELARQRLAGWALDIARADAAEARLAQANEALKYYAETDGNVWEIRDANGVFVSTWAGFAARAIAALSRR